MKNSILKIFFIVASLLLLSHLIVDFFIIGNPFENRREEQLTSTEDLLFSVFDNYGIKNNWISKRTSRRQKIDTLTTEYYVQIPPDIPVPLLIREMHALFNNDDYKISALEKEINGRSIVTISSADNYQVITEFIRNRTIKRDVINLAFIIIEFDNLNPVDAARLLQLKVNFSLLFNPSNVNEERAKEIALVNKEYALLLSDEIKEIAFKLDKNFSGIRLRESFTNILRAFPFVKIFVYDDSHSFMTPLIYDVMTLFAGNNKIKFLPLSQLNDELFKTETSYLTSELHTNNEIFLTSASSFLEKYDELNSFRKKGNKIVSPSELVN